MNSLIIATLSLPLLFAQPADKPASNPTVKPKSIRIYQDQSWIHIGDGNFSPQSNGASDLTTESEGEKLTINIRLSAENRKQVADTKWKSLELRGSVIGNDTGDYGKTTPTVVTIDGKKVGEITKSGSFTIRFAKSHVPKSPAPLNVIITSGQNSANDKDDQELGLFQLWLTDQEAPKLKVPEKKVELEEKPADSGDR